jgi:predicted SnoaL-like aldol condensation-catalyzing enzyme
MCRITPPRDEAASRNDNLHSYEARRCLGNFLSSDLGMAANKNSAVRFLQLAATGRTREAYDEYVGTSFRHHNPYFKGDAQALMTGMEENARQNPDKRLDVLHALEDGDLVVVHSRVQHRPDDRGAAVMHLFRFEAGRIAELWDVGQAVPEESLNANGMF